MSKQHAIQDWLAFVESRASQLPHAYRDIKWGNVIVYSLERKMFLLMAEGRISLKVPREYFLSYTAQPGIIPAPYLARHCWIAIESATAFSHDELRVAIATSHALVGAGLSKKKQRELGLLKC